MYPNQKVFSAYLCQKISSWFKHLRSNTLTIADIGSGSGLLTHYLANSFFNSTVIGIETDEKKREKASKQFNNCTFILEQDINKHIQKASCDLIIISLTLHHVDPAKRNAFINKAKALLKPNGYLIIIEFNPYTFFSKKEFCKELIKPKEVRRMLSNMETKLIYFGYPKPFNYGEILLSWMPYGSLYAIITQKN